MIYLFSYLLEFFDRAMPAGCVSLKDLKQGATRYCVEGNSSEPYWQGGRNIPYLAILIKH